jgi:protein-disulfide isomerase
MSKNKHLKKNASNVDRSKPPVAVDDATFSASPVVFTIGLLLLLTAIAATGTLVFSHFTGMAAPGCGVGSGCAEAAKSVWGKVPGVNWPVSSLGLTFFVSILIGWISTHGRIAPALTCLVRLGALASLFYLGVMLFAKLSCQYCLVAHIANLAFWVWVEVSRGRSASTASLPILARVAVAFALCTIALAGAELWQRRAVLEEKESELAKTTKEIVDQTIARQDHPANAGDSNTTTTSTSEGRPLHSPPGGFTGRWRIGPEDAPIRVVIFSDYQCPDCQDIERQVMQIFQSRNDMSLSHKHYPMSTDCNVHMGRANMHQNACWAARAVEAVGIVGGNDAFWKMHKWMFEEKGFFQTQQELEVGLRAAGLTIQQQQQALQILNSDQSVDPVKVDIEEAHMLGLHFTPMIFINGVELRGFVKNPTALARAISQVAAANPKPASPTQDKPPLAIEKCIGDWRAQPMIQMPPQLPSYPMGPDDAPVKVVVWYDDQFPATTELDSYIRKSLQDRGDIQYIYRNYPQDRQCNPRARTPRVTKACWVSAVSIAAGQLGGTDAYWKTHDWMLANQQNLTDEALREAAPDLGLDPDKLIAAVNSAEIKEEVVKQLDLAAQVIRQGVPTIYVNNKWVARWKFDEEIILDDIFDEASKGRAGR